MRYVSVCAGIEAATVAWHHMGWTPAWFSEIEPFPSAVLAHHYPEVRNLGDMTKYEEWPDESIDLLVGGTPCQSFSVAGLRKGLSDPRGGLMLTYLEIARRYRPQWVVWENVPGVLSSNGGRDFGSFLGALGELGYGFAYRVLDAQWFGVAQRRRRVFVVGYLGDWKCAAQVLFERESVRRDTPPSREARQGVARGTADGAAVGISDTVGALTDGAHMGGGSTGRMPTPGAYLPCVANPLTARMHKGINTTLDEGQTPIVTPGAGFNVAHAFDARQSDVLQYGDKTGALDTDGHSMAVAVRTANTSANGHGVAVDVAHTLDQAQGQCVAQPVAFTTEQTPKFSSDAALTLTQGSPSGGGHPQCVMTTMQVRRLTPVECERLQGFPDGYTNIPWRGKPESPDGPRYKALGNSMAVPVMRWIGERIAAVDAITTQKGENA